MHIPDGYLSPSTCACLYGASAPFWYVSLKRLKTRLTSRSVPLLSVFAAFSFVVMMFNLPLPGGTTGHAVGMAIASIVLGPAVSILAISMALLIQALFFGDGGITAYGANCFNMAIVGSLSAFAIYRALAWKSELGSARRALAAGLAGYCAINLSALFAAIEFGIQPIYFHDRLGTPLYAPYPLSVSIPAMMLGHLTIAGSAEFIISSGLVRYLQSSDPEMLRPTAPDAPQPLTLQTPSLHSFALWLGLAFLMLLTPLGILAVGSAWGEWSPEEIGSPRGMAQLHTLWHAPFAGYAPAFLTSAKLAYLFCAILGVLLILLLGWALSRIFGNDSRRRSFLESSIHHLVVALQDAFLAEDAAASRGLLQRMDPRVKLTGFAALVIATVSTHSLLALCSILLLGVLLALLSHISVPAVLGKAWLAVLLFTGVIALPALFLTAGTPVYHLPLVPLSITASGLRTAAFLVLRSETTATLALLLVSSTLWAHLMRALRWFRLPSVAVVVLAMTYRYLFVFLQTAHSMFESRQTKLVGRMTRREQRRMAAASVGVLLDKSLHLSSEVHLAMQARGYRGDVQVLEDLRMNALDWLQLTMVVMGAAFILQIGS